MKRLLSRLLFSGQDRTGLKLAKEPMSSRLYSMGYRISMLLCSCKSPRDASLTDETDMLRLLFMTYNGWVMIAVSIGAFVGYLLFGGNASSTKETACH